MAAETVMDTSSPENSDSRKRPLDVDIETGSTKRSNQGAGENGGDSAMFHLKILVPSVAAGAIIGKGGETIAQLQQEKHARVKMSRANDFYPGTSERVCLISGSIESIMEVLDFINAKIREKPEGLKSGTEHEIKSEREKQIKILVPNSTAGMIIGKGGNYIKQLKEESGAYVQISQKAKDQTLQERCITVMGDAACNKKACAMILSKVQEDPLSGSSLNVSYADVTGPVANFNPTGSPYAQTASQQSFTASLNSTFPQNHQLITYSSGFSEAATLSNMSLIVNLEPGSNHSIPIHVLNQIITSLSAAYIAQGYPEQIATELSTALNTLAKYGMLRLNPSYNTTTTNGFLGFPTLDSSGSSHNGITSGMFGAVGTSAPRAAIFDINVDSFLHPSSRPLSPPQINNNTFNFAKTDRKDSKVELEVPEVLVGAILGPGGRSLVELQHLSGTLIQISKKGVYAPGTRNRVVSISGSPSAVNTAQYYIEQRLGEEKIKRQQQVIVVQ